MRQAGQVRLRLTGQGRRDFDKSSVQGVGLEWAGEQMGDLETASTTLLRYAFREENREVTEGGMGSEEGWLGWYQKWNPGPHIHYFTLLGLGLTKLPRLTLNYLPS